MILKATVKLKSAFERKKQHSVVNRKKKNKLNFLRVLIFLMFRLYFRKSGHYLEAYTDIKFSSVRVSGKKKTIKKTNTTHLY